MSDRTVSWQMSLNDMVTGKLKEADEAGKKLQSTMGGIKEGLAVLGISFGIFKGVEFISSAKEAFEKLHQSEEQMKNTMENMGTYSEENFEKAVKGAKDLAANVKFSTSEFIEMKSQIGLVGNLSLDELDKISATAADMAAKTGTGLVEAGNSLAKAMNNPLMARRLGMQLKIDPAIIAHIKELSEQGKTAEARMLLLKAANDKVGGAAKAAFNADPLARFNKMMGSFKMSVGELAVKLLTALMPAIESVGAGFKAAGIWMKEHKTGLEYIGAAIGGVVLAIGVWRAITLINTAIQAISVVWTNANAMALAVYGTETELAAGKSGLMTLAQWALNTAMTANPIGLIIVGIAALVAGLIYAYNHISGFRGAMNATWAVMKTGASIVSEVFVGLGKIIKGALTLDVKSIEAGYTELTSAVAKAGTRIKDAAKKGYAEGVAEIAAKDEKSTSTDPKKEGKASTVTKGAMSVDGDGAEKKTKMAGNKTISITIKIDSLIKDFKITTSNMRESASSVKEQIVNAMTSAMNDSQVVAER